jgi:hypothetical protein
MAENQTCSPASQRATSIKIYLGLVAIIVVLTGLTMFLPLEVNQGQQANWLSVIIVALLGGVGLNLTHRAGFPEMWDVHVSSRQRFWLPALIGMALGAVAVLFDLVQPLGTQAQTRFPDSLVVFSLAGIIEEIIIHLFLTTLLIWLISGLVFKGRHQTPVFWIIAVGGAVLYWLLQISAIMTYFPEHFSIALAAQAFFIITCDYYGRRVSFSESWVSRCSLVTIRLLPCLAHHLGRGDRSGSLLSGVTGQYRLLPSLSAFIHWLLSASAGKRPA